MRKMCMRRILVCPSSKSTEAEKVLLSILTPGKPLSAKEVFYQVDSRKKDRVSPDEIRSAIWTLADADMIKFTPNRKIIKKAKAFHIKNPDGKVYA